MDNNCREWRDDPWYNSYFHSRGKESFIFCNNIDATILIVLFYNSRNVFMYWDQWSGTDHYRNSYFGKEIYSRNPCGSTRWRHRQIMPSKFLIFPFKILNGETSSNLLSLLPPMIDDRERRHGRNRRYFYLSNPRIDSVKNSFVYKTCHEWNSLNIEARITDSLFTFKRLVRGGLISFISTLCELPRYPSVLYTRLRYGCSGLKADLFKANLIPDEICECRTGPETLFHFLYDCPFYDVTRDLLMFELNELGLTNLSIPFLFDCDNNLDSSLILNAQRAIFRFILSSRRFSWACRPREGCRCDPVQHQFFCFTLFTPFLPLFPLNLLIPLSSMRHACLNFWTLSERVPYQTLCLETWSLVILAELFVISFVNKNFQK